MSLRLPNLVIGGVRKCGTTSLFEWLRDHPDVCASSSKETAYLMDRDSPYFLPDRNVHDHGLEGYGAFFPDCGEERFLMEATTRYIYQETACRVLAAMEPQPHVVFVLREPGARLHSAFRYARNNRGSLHPDTGLGQFLACVRSGRVGELVQYSPTSLVGASMKGELAELDKEVRFGEYAELLHPWKEAFAPDKLHVYLFERLKDRPRRFTTRLAQDVGLDPSFYDDYDFRPKNKTVHVRSHGIHRIVRSLAPLVPRNSLTRSLYRTYLKTQSLTGTPIPPEEQEALEELRGHYAPHNERLAAEFGLDLSAWA